MDRYLVCGQPLALTECFQELRDLPNHEQEQGERKGEETVEGLCPPAGGGHLDACTSPSRGGALG